MTPEQIKRIVKVCEQIGWPKTEIDGLEYMLNPPFKDDELWRRERTKSSGYIFYLLDFDIEAALEKYLRQWLESKWEQVSHVTRGGKHYILLGYYTRREPEIELENNDYLDLLLTAVAQTLVQEAKP